MTEQEYITASNLARIRAANAVLSAIVPIGDMEPIKEAKRILWRLEEELDKSLKIEQEK